MLWLSGCLSSMAVSPAPGLCHFLRDAVTHFPVYFPSQMASFHLLLGEWQVTPWHWLGCTGWDEYRMRGATFFVSASYSSGWGREQGAAGARLRAPGSVASLWSPHGRSDSGCFSVCQGAQGMQLTHGLTLAFWHTNSLWNAASSLLLCCIYLPRAFKFLSSAGRFGGAVTCASHSTRLLKTVGRGSVWGVA